MSWFSQGPARKAINGGFADVMPAYYRDIPGLFQDYVKPEVLIAVVSPMDKHGYFSTGCDGSLSAALFATAKTVLLEVNPHMPRSLSSTQIHISQVDALWENDAPMMCLPPKEIDEVSARIGGFIAEEIPDGATLQLGIGAIPDAVGNALQSKHHLGIHTEMFTDAMADLVERGVVTGARKNINTGLHIGSFAGGSSHLYEVMSANPAFRIMPGSYAVDPMVIMQNDNLVSINTIVEMDLTGQVCSESIGPRQLSGSGGAFAFAYGAFRSKGGRGILAFPSRTAKGQSKIRPMLAQGAVVTVPRNYVDYIVTEYGVAPMRGRTVRERAENLIAIAHPDVREELRFEAKKLLYI